MIQHACTCTYTRWIGNQSFNIYLQPVCLRIEYQSQTRRVDFPDQGQNIVTIERISSYLCANVIGPNFICRARGPAHGMLISWIMWKPGLPTQRIPSMPCVVPRLHMYCVASTGSYDQPTRAAFASISIRTYCTPLNLTQSISNYYVGCFDAG